MTFSTERSLAGSFNFESLAPDAGTESFQEIQFRRNANSSLYTETSSSQSTPTSIPNPGALLGTR